MFGFYIKKEKEKKCVWVKVNFLSTSLHILLGHTHTCSVDAQIINVCISPQILKLVTPDRVSQRKTRKSTNKGESNTECGSTMPDHVGTSQVKFRLCSAIFHLPCSVQLWATLFLSSSFFPLKWQFQLASKDKESKSSRLL